MRYELERRPSSPAEGLVVATTDWLRSDEPALMLVEENRVTEDYRSIRRWQLVYVGRGNHVYEFPRDLGPSDNFKGVEGFLLFSGGEDSVAALMEMANAERENRKLRNILDEVAATSTLVEDAVRLEEQKRELVKRNERTLRNQYGLYHERKLF